MQKTTRYVTDQRFAHHDCPGKELELISKQRYVEIFFLTPFSRTLLKYQCFASQMALLGFYHDSSLFTSPLTSVNAVAHDDRHCGNESARGIIREDKSTKNLWLYRSALSTVLCPLGRLRS